LRAPCPLPAGECTPRQCSAPLAPAKNPASSRCGAAVLARCSPLLLAPVDDAWRRTLRVPCPFPCRTPRSAYPRIDPAIITLITAGDWALLGRKAEWPTGRCGVGARVANNAADLNCTKGTRRPLCITLQSVRLHGARRAHPVDRRRSPRCAAPHRALSPRAPPPLRPSRYSTLAGFLEVGETLEQALVREVEEESAVAVAPGSIRRGRGGGEGRGHEPGPICGLVKARTCQTFHPAAVSSATAWSRAPSARAVSFAPPCTLTSPPPPGRYVASQPWPFPRSLMVGFRAQAAAATGGGGGPRGLDLLQGPGRAAAMDVGIRRAGPRSVFRSDCRGATNGRPVL
jgi:hypothetical protein